MSVGLLDAPTLERFVTWTTDTERWSDLPTPDRAETIVEHARDIPDAAMLRLIDQLQRALYWPYERQYRHPHWVSQWDLAGALRLVGYRAHHGFNEMPSALVRAKCARLIARGLLAGCACGCRGDFEVTDTGRAFLEAGSTP